MAVASSPQRTSAKQSAFWKADVELRSIQAKMSKGHPLTKGDITFLLHEIDFPAHSESGQSGILVLIKAAHYDLYPIKDVLDLIERKAKYGGKWWVCYPSMDYYAALFPGNHWSSAAVNADLRAVTRKKKSRTRLDQEETKFIMRTLALPNPDDRQRAAWIPLQKHDLDQRSLKWIRSQIGRQISASKKPETEYWKFIQRIVDFRNRKHDLH